MRHINGWRYIYKDRNRVHIELRLGKLTFFRLAMDPDDRIWALTLCNFRWEW